MGSFNIEDIESSKVGLFSMSPQWFRHSGYEILEGGKGLVYITPQQNAKIEWYKPFEEFPQILMEFYNLVSGICEIEKGWWEVDKSEKPAINEQFYWGRDKSRKKKLAEILFRFVSRYGLFGLFWQDVMDIYPEFREGKEFEGYKALLSGSLLLTNGQRTVPYDEYAKHFFPQLKPPFPMYTADAKKEERHRFLNGYSESVNYLLGHPAFARVGYHLKIKKEFENSGANINDFYRNAKGLPWSKYLEIEAWPLGIKLIHEEGKWHLKWQFKTLLDALQIIHINNIAGTMGQRVKICADPKCNVSHLRNSLFHSDKCKNRFYKRAERQRKKTAIELYEKGMSVEQIAKEIPESDIKTIAKWLREAQKNNSQ